MADQSRDPLQQSVDQACAGQTKPLLAFLERHGALPGPKPNLRFARDAACALLSKGETGRSLLNQLRALSPSAAAERTASEFLPFVGVLGAGIEAARTPPQRLESALLPLQPFAEDPRAHVRACVVHALREALNAQGDAAVEALHSWTDGYLQACAVCDALADTSVLQKLREPERVVNRLQECFDLLAQAPRSHERSQGYRALRRLLGLAPAAVGRRFPAEIAQWLQARAETQNPELREAISTALHSMRGAGVRQGDVEQAQRALDESKPPPRDPRSYVGPTRSRGSKARKRGAQR